MSDYDDSSLFSSPSSFPTSSPVLANRSIVIPDTPQSPDPPDPSTVLRVRRLEAGPSSAIPDTPQSPDPSPRRNNYPSPPLASPNRLSSTRRRNLQDLDIRRGDTRGLSRILSDRRRDRDQNQENPIDEGSRNGRRTIDSGIPSTRTRTRFAIGPPRQAGSVNNRRSIVEVDDDSDDDIVFTGQNLNPNPPPPPEPRFNFRNQQRGNEGQHNRDNSRAPSPAAFRRMMNEVDVIIAQRRDAHDAIVNEQEDERRRQVLSPPIQPPNPRPRIGLGGGGLFRNGQVAEQPPNPMMQDPMLGFQYPALRNLAAVANRPGYNRILGNILGWNDGDGQQFEDNPLARLRMLDMGIAAALGVGGAGGAGARQEDIKDIISKVELPKHPEPINKNFTSNFDMDLIKSDDPIELDDEGNIITIKNQNKKNKKPKIICSNCPNTLLNSTSYKSNQDKIWVLRCGHLIDEKCLNNLQTPKTTKDLLTIIRYPDGDLLDPDNDQYTAKRRRKGASRKVKKVEPKKPDEFPFKCPVEGCCKEHKSVNVGDKWIPKENEGALAAYV